MNSNITKVLGTAGCGKTSYLIRQIEAACEKYHPSKIGAVSFSKAATVELVDRIVLKAGASPASIQNVRTVHSMCFRLMGLKKADVAEKNLLEFFVAHSDLAWTPRSMKYEEDGQEIDLSDNQKNYNRACFNMMNILRNKMTPEAQYPPDVLQFQKRWVQWIRENDYVDFTGMLEQALYSGFCPDIDVLFIDECQDSTPLQFALLRQWSEKVEHAVFVGDPKQAIYGWAGSDPNSFETLPAENTIRLTQSYRVPKAITEYARLIFPNLDMIPTDTDGEITRGLTPDLSKPGSHMILCRCNYQLNRWKKWLVRRGTPWHNPYRERDKSFNPLSTKIFTNLNSYNKLKQGGPINAAELKTLMEGIIAKDNLKKGAKTAFKKLKLDDGAIIQVGDLPLIGFTEEFMALKKPLNELVKLTGTAGQLAMKMEEKEQEENVKSEIPIVGTVHSAKGGEADHVHFDMSTSVRCAKGMTRDAGIMEEEKRIAYVAITRAKNSLQLLQQKGQYNRVLPRI